MTDERLLSLQEVSDRCGIAVDTLRRLRMHGQGPRSFLVANRVRVRESALEAWLAQQEQAEQERLSRLAQMAS
jgi:predicted DNA-binding transcriptional regulator AlpA